MENEQFEIHSDWTYDKGTNLKNTVDVKLINNSTLFKRLPLEDIAGANRSICLVNLETTICNIHLNCIQEYSIFSISLVTDCPKLELFIGDLQEYSGIIYGELVDDFDGDQVYKFDIEIENAITTDLILKLLNHKNHLWIYGIKLHLLANLNTQKSATNLKPSVNFQNVEQILSDSKLSPSAEKCKEFLKSYMNKNNPINRPPTMEMLMSSIMNSNFEKLNLNGNHLIESRNDETSEEKNHLTKEFKNTENNFTVDLLKQFVEIKISEIELKINKRLDQMEARQNEKLDKILEILGKKT